MRILVFLALTTPLMAQPPKAPKYPTTRRDASVVDDYHGTEIPDPYRWLEDDRAPATERWVTAQNKVTRAYLDALPYRGEIAERLEQYQNYPRRSVPIRAGQYYFHYHNSGLQNQPVIYRQTGLAGEAKVFIDPNELSDEGTTTATLAGFSQDDRYVVTSHSVAGSDWHELRVQEVATGRELEDKIEWVKFGGATWHEDGFFYSAYEKPEGDIYAAQNRNQRVLYHRLGTTQAEDELVFEDPENPLRYYYTDITEDGQWLLLYKQAGTEGNEVYFRSAADVDAPFQPLITGFADRNAVVDFIDGHFLVHTNRNAPNYRLVAIAPEDTAEAHWRVVIPENEHLLEGVSRAGAHLFAAHLVDATTRIATAPLAVEEVSLAPIELPGIGVASLPRTDADADADALFLSFSSFNQPGGVYRLDLANRATEAYFEPEVPGLDPDRYAVEQQFYSSKDGTRVPMFVIRRRDLPKDGQAPAWLYGYGGFNISLTPGYRPEYLVIADLGGVVAIPNLRGGGEYGEAWHKAGMLEKKQTVFDDFIAAAEFLPRTGYVHKDRIAIAGRSNGGLLVGACMTQRPELFAVAFPGVGVLDMLRYHRFTVGWGWVPEYGNAEADPAAFQYLRAYSPLHNLKPGTAYPSTLITTADHDDRVVPAHAFKFAAALQHAHTGPHPVLIRIETSAGHGAGTPTAKRLAQSVDEIAFFFHEAGGLRK